MSNRFDLLTQQLFQKNISDCSVEELRTLANQHPYFAPAQYALLKKLQQADSPDYAAQLQKAILYYPNPPLFEQFINEEAYEIDFPQTFIEKSNNHEEQESTIEIEEAHQPRSTESLALTTVEEPVMAQEEELEEVPVLDKPGEQEVPLNIPMPKLTEPKNEGSATIAFEPYQTVDYFASQGIKLSQEEATKDRFGRQLKSFTEWLKTMKKIPATEQIKNIDSASQQKVENLAAHSVEQSDIVTETMAEVWAKQGNREKAMEIYNKLSLLNPSKRAYFAAKVEFLKKEI